MPATHFKAREDEELPALPDDQQPFLRIVRNRGNFIWIAIVRSTWLYFKRNKHFGSIKTTIQ